MLTGLWAVRQWDQSCLVTFLEHTGTIRSDVERRRVLEAAAARQRLGHDARRAYVAAAQAIGGERERQAALASLSGEGEPRRSASEPAETRWDTELVLSGTRDGRPRRVVVNARDMFYRSARSDPHRIGPAGELYVEESLAGRVRVLRAVPGPGGAPQYTYTVDGVPEQFDGAARAWMTAVIRELTGG